MATFPPGTHVSGAFNIQIKAHEILTFACVLQPADQADNALTMDSVVELNDSPNGSMPWYEVMRDYWRGGQKSIKGNDMKPGFSWMTGRALDSRRGRVTVTINKTLTCQPDLIKG